MQLTNILAVVSKCLRFKNFLWTILENKICHIHDNVKHYSFIFFRLQLFPDTKEIFQSSTQEIQRNKLKSCVKNRLYVR